MHETYETIEPDGHGDHQLLPVKGGRYDKVFHGPEGEDVGDLHTDIEPIGHANGKIGMVVHSGWMPNEEQVRQIEAGAHIRLSVWMYPIPPMAMSVEAPVCSCHGAEMAWDSTDGGYYCFAQRDTHGAPPADSSPLEQARKDFTPE